jgi:membrane protein involved in colicin uptake
MAMLKAQQEADARNEAAMKEYNDRVADAQEKAKAWSEILGVVEGRRAAEKERVEAERKAGEERLRAEAEKKFEEDQRIKAEKEAEQNATESKTKTDTSELAKEGEDTDNAVEMGSEPQPIGRGVFGNIYDQFKGKAKEAIDFLRKIKGGEAIAALHHKDIGDISLVWGNKKAGFNIVLNKLLA